MRIAKASLERMRVKPAPAPPPAPPVVPNTAAKAEQAMSSAMVEEAVLRALSRPQTRKASGYRFAFHRDEAGKITSVDTTERDGVDVAPGKTLTYKLNVLRDESGLIVGVNATPEATNA